MIAILSRITESTKDSKQYLEDLQEASINAYGRKKYSPQLPQIVQIRQDLHLYWGDVANFLRVECFQTAHRVVGLQIVKRPSELITALGELQAEAENCSFRGKALVGQHDEFIRSFTARNIRFPGSDATTASFTRACGSLRAGLIDLLVLIEDQCQACATYERMVRTDYRPAMLDEFTLLGKEWRPYAVKTRETYSYVKTLSDDIIGSGEERPTLSKDSKGCIIM
jgi:hypothetical protein